MSVVDLFPVIDCFLCSISLMSKIKSNISCICSRVTAATYPTSFIKSEISLGYDMKVMQIILGHSDYSTTANIYGHLTKKMERTALDSIMDELF